jgi:serine protease Do
MDLIPVCRRPKSVPTALLLALWFAPQAPAAQEPGAAGPASALEARLTPEVLVVRAAAPAVVYVVAQRPSLVGWDSLGKPVTQLRPVSGSGVVVDRNGFIVTNYHILGSDARSIQVSFDPDTDPKTYPAELLSYVEAEDLALLKIQGERDFPVVLRGTSSDLMIGERVVAIGNPFRQRLSVSTGIISGLHRNVEIATGNSKFVFDDLIQTDASINPGNSGGPLLNVLGELIGINCAVNERAENMGFAIPVDRVEEVLRDHLFAPSAARAWLGFEVEQERTFRVCEVVPEGPADLAGLRQGERLLAMEGLSLQSPDDYRAARLPLVPGQAISLRVAAEDGQERELSLRGWEKADGILFQRAGMTVEPFAAGRSLGLYQRVRVGRVARDGPAQLLGLLAGDVLDAVRVKGSPRVWSVASPMQIASLVSSLAPGTQLEVEVLRDDDLDQRLSRAELYRGVLVLR